MASDATGWHIFKNLFLLLFSFSLLPLNTIVIATVYLWSKLWPSKNESCLDDKGINVPQKTVLVTGMSMAKGLALARQFHRRGHRVIGADSRSFCMARVSTAVDRFIALPRPSGRDQADCYIAEMLYIVKNEHVDLWVSVSDVHAAIEDAKIRDIIETTTKVTCIQLGEEDTTKLHEKHLFMEYAKSIGLPVPDSQVVDRTAAIVHFLNKRDLLRFRPGWPQYLVKQIEQDDHQSRFDMALLPHSTEQETMRCIQSIPVGKANPFLIQQFIPGEEYCTHALVVKGQVRAFLACPSSALLLHYEALPSECPLTQAMLSFTKKVAAAGGDSFTGHVSFDFLINPVGDKKGNAEDILRTNMFSIECNPRVHTAVLLFNDTPEVIDAFFDPMPSQLSVVFPRDPKKYYWVGQDLVQLVFYPFYQFVILGTLTFAQLRQSIGLFLTRICYWKDGTFEVWDPWPWWWLYHVYWPIQFLKFLVRGRWYSINVSTGKAFSAE